METRIIDAVALKVTMDSLLDLVDILHNSGMSYAAATVSKSGNQQVAYISWQNKEGDYFSAQLGEYIVFVGNVCLTLKSLPEEKEQ